MSVAPTRQKKISVWPRSRHLARALSKMARVSERVAPSTVGVPLDAYSEWLQGEPELRLLTHLAKGARTVVDVGAADGTYSYFLGNQARICHAFEANPLSASRLKARLPKVNVHNVALSDALGSATLRVPRRAGRSFSGWGTIHADNSLQHFGEHETSTFDVRTVPLDTFVLADVDIMKIDVEGHELAVLHGASRTIRASNPIMLIEAEERHRPGALKSLWQFMQAHEYGARVLDCGRLLSADSVLRGDHNGNSKWNNFLFAPKAKLAHGVLKSLCSE